jgi:polyhydroxybutyrate depolymerase
MSRRTTWSLAAVLVSGLSLAQQAIADPVVARRVDAAPLSELTENLANEPGWRERSLRVGDAERWFRTYVPRDMAAGYPIVIVLHGGTESMRAIFAAHGGGLRAWQGIAERDGILLLAPNGTNATTGDAKGDNQAWNDLRTEGVQRNPNADDVSFIEQLADWANINFHTDRGRTYVTGASNGGMMIYRLLVEAPERFAAAAAFIANLPDGSRLLRKPSHPTPLLIMNGTNDRVVRWNGGAVARNRGRVVSSEATFAWWIDANRAEGNPSLVEALADRDNSDDCRLTRRIYEARPGGAPVVIYTMEGGGHSVPSILYERPNNFPAERSFGPICRDVEGAEIAWEFLRQFRRGGAPQVGVAGAR